MQKLIRIRILLDFFSDETDQGKLYINYPMLESFRYTKQLPDHDYWSYKCKTSDIRSFKKNSAEFSAYPNSDFACFRFTKDFSKIKDGTPDRWQQLSENWSLIIEQNLKKSNYLCNGKHEMPENKESISQVLIFSNQEETIIKEDDISILNSIPMFLFEYFEHIPYSNDLRSGDGN